MKARAETCKDRKAEVCCAICDKPEQYPGDVPIVLDGSGRRICGECEEDMKEKVNYMEGAILDDLHNSFQTWKTLPQVISGIPALYPEWSVADFEGNWSLLHYRGREESLMADGLSEVFARALHRIVAKHRLWVEERNGEVKFRLNPRDWESPVVAWPSKAGVPTAAKWKAPYFRRPGRSVARAAPLWPCLAAPTPPHT